MKNLYEILSNWLSVDPLAIERPGLSPYNYCSWNPVGKTDPYGMIDDWVEHTDQQGNKSVVWDQNAISPETTKQGDRYLGKSGFGVENDKLTYYSPAGEKLPANFSLSEVTVDGGEMSASARDISAARELGIYRAQSKFLRGCVDITAGAFNTAGNGLTYTGTGLMIIPGAQPVGGAFIGIGTVSSSIGTVMNMTANAANGEWSQFTNNTISLLLSGSSAIGLNFLNLNNNQLNFLKGYSATQISIFNNIIDSGLNKNNKK